ncbi:unnamed protein product [Mytilus coruscus]|uniref:Uncharacterized protein n=1 Tax=Mytilus coruscus TaxID=42192 RepID=A0A6J8AX51_MYTCO|nr:unnamed protein product [Mytilus coruscus]
MQQKIGDAAKEDNQFHGIVLAELVAYIEDSRMDTEVDTIFRLADLLNIYTNRLEQFEGDGLERLIPPIDVSASRYEHLKPLPESYTVVPPVMLPREKSEIPLLNGSLVADGTSISSALNLEYRWLKHVYDKIAADDTEDMEYSWAAFHANRLEGDSDTLIDIILEEMGNPFMEQSDDLLILDTRDIVDTRVAETDSLKASERSRRGKGIRRRVLPDSKVPGNWEAFLRVDENKKELFAFISEQLVSRDIVFDEEKQIVSTTGSNVNCRKEKDVSEIAPCTQEEADTRMMLHVNDAVADGHKCVMIRTVDTDVVVIAISVLQKIESILELWIAFGVGKNFRYLSFHDIANALGPEKSHGLLFFHAFTGCDQVSSFANKGKKSAWDTWTSYEEITGNFDLLSNEESSSKVLLDHMGDIEHFVVLMYDKTSESLKKGTSVTITLYNKHQELKSQSQISMYKLFKYSRCQQQSSGFIKLHILKRSNVGTT